MSYKEQLTALAEELSVDTEVVTKISAIVESAIATSVEAKETELKAQLEEAVAQSAELVAEAKLATEVEVKAQAEALAKQFVAENKERFVQTEDYDNMVSFVSNLKEAFAGVWLEDSERAELAETKAALAEAIAAKEALEESAKVAECATIASTMMTESQLSDMQKARVLRLVEMTNSNSTEEFKSIVEMLISEVKGSDKKDDEDEGDDKGSKEDDKEDLDEAQKREKELMAAYAKAYQG